MPSRPASRPASAILSPWPSSPRRRSAGTRTSSNTIVAVVEPIRPIFCSGVSALRPGVSAGTRKQEIRSLAGPGHHLVEVGLPAMGGPGLLATDDVVVAVTRGLGAHRGGVGAGMRLGEAVGAEQVAGEHLREPLLPLLVGSRGEQAEAGQGVHADADADAGPRRRDLLEHLQVDLVRLAAAAELLRVRQAQQAGAAEGAEDVAREGGRGLGLVDVRAQLLVDDRARQVDEVG